MVQQLKGEVKLGEFASANDEDEYEWSVTVEGKGKPHDRIKQLVRVGHLWSHGAV